MANKQIPESHFPHFRTMAIGLEIISSQQGAKILYDLTSLTGVTGHSMTDIQTAKKLTFSGNKDTNTKNNSFFEPILCRALYIYGNYNGFVKL